MRIESFQFKKNSGWSTKEFPKLDSPHTIIFVFGSPSFSEAPIEISKLVQAYPQSKIVGCSSAGEIFSDQVFDDSLSVAVMQLQHTEIKTAFESISLPTESKEVGKRLASQLNQPNLAGVIVLSDGLRVNGSALIEGITSVLPNHVVVSGGLAGDGSNFKKTWVIQNQNPAVGLVSAVAFYGNRIKLEHGTQGGWDIFGPERVITKSTDNILFELDGKPALTLYKQYLGEKAKDLPASGLLFPLQVRSDRNQTTSVVRTILGVDEEKQCMIFAGNVPRGHFAQLMRANFDRLIDGAARAASGISEPSNSLTIAISCVGRRLVLGERIEEEIEATLSNLPKNTKLIGFYSYGEISPAVKGAACELHNQTMTLTTISEK